MAGRFLEENGLRILEYNFRMRTGEIDIIARDGCYYVFVEVKYRKTASAGLPEEAVDYKKVRKICHVADYYRCTHHFDDSVPVRFDVIAIEGENIRWYKNAFAYEP